MIKDRKFTQDEVIYLIGYTQSIVFEAVLSNLKSDKVPFEETSLKLLRKWGQLLAYPEIILRDRPHNKPKKKSKLKIQERDLLFKILGNRSPDLLGLNDEELVAETFRQLKYYS